jgi:hypothetical protein
MKTDKSRISIFEIFVAVSFAIPLPFANALSIGAILAFPILVKGNFIKLKAARHGITLGVTCFLSGFLLLRFRNDVSFDRILFLNIAATTVNLIVLGLLLACFLDQKKFFSFVLFLFGGSVAYPLFVVNVNFAELWKYSIGIPVTFMIFYLLKNVKFIGALAGLALVFISFTADYRSLTFIVLITVVLSSLSVFKRKSMLASETNFIKILRGGSILAFFIYGGSTFFTSGLTSSQSIQIGGISTGRIEFIAGLKFMSSNFFGFGIGSKPSGELLQTLRDSFVGSGIGLDSSYLYAFLLRDSIKFHSFILDSWSYFGIFGLILGFCSVLLIGRALLETISSPNQAKHHIFLLLVGLWDALYSPFTSNGKFVIIAMVLSLHLRTFKKESNVSDN